MELLSSARCFGGTQKRFSHWSESNNCTMTFSVFEPPGLNEENPMPVVYWLSGLTCTDENFVQKAGAQHYAAELGLILVAPDTSPRGNDVPDAPNGEWDLGIGAGFYLNATEAPWHTHYNMYDYIVSELPDLIINHFPTTAKAAISGHSMGGHGALACAIKNPELYSSVSAFAPIVNPMQCPWGVKAFQSYLGKENKDQWRAYDTCELIKEYGLVLPMLIDQGTEDNFLTEQLLTPNLERTIQATNTKNELKNNRTIHPEHSIRMQTGYDHSYFFIASLIGEHLKFHKQHLER